MLNNQQIKKDESRVCPKLRFLEFKNHKGWLVKSIGNICESYSGGTPTTTNKEFYGGNIPFIRSGEINKSSTELFLTQLGLERSSAKLVNKGDLLFAMYGANSGDVAVSKINGAINQAILCLKSKESNDFIYQILSFKKYWIVNKYLQGGQGNLSSEIIKTIEISLPEIKEQLKIVDCLSSLDELIQNESSKLEGYKQHKDSLLQQLFPKNGESLPSLRFDEFCEEWENIELSKIAKPVKKKNTDQNKILVLSLSNEYGLVSQVDYFQKKIAGENTDKYIVLQKNDFVYNDRITKNSTYGTIKRLSLYEEGIVSPIYKCFRFEKNQNPVFWEYFFESKSHENEIRQIINEGARAGRYNISTDSFLSINVMIPSHLEQEKIASCLTSLDEIITRQNNYIECLKEHKKGLMQQLFPVFEDFSA
ncbi:restriction endonuclease subunit S [Proteus mirabilis]|uniref:restriction endonuclease subunit S n=1 Tax=Proteus mirabilis TaxID=584 RepID=UPI000881D1B1|nr:restriction endonuclease subunit S [Proteus mirabilis]MCU9564159.1 restriction endonuclease subunit S [Proteus mirabilis]SDC45986.1 type I restriction enzyme, S subunit [Proteus mirabilis]